MAFLTYLLCTVFLQLATGQIAAYGGQGGVNSPQFGNLFNARSLNSNTPLPKNPGFMATPNFARNVALAGNGLSSIANRNSANAVVSTSNIPNANMDPNLNLASNFANAKAVAASLDSNVAKPNLLNAASLDQTQIPRSIANVANPTLSRNVASGIASSQFRLGSSFNSSAHNYNSNSVNNLANRNIASSNSASLPNSWYPNAATSYSQSVLHGPTSGQQYGIRVEADALEIAGNVAVTGSLPIHGTVSFNDRVPTGGTATVNYVCSG